MKRAIEAGDLELIDENPAPWHGLNVSKSAVEVVESFRVSQIMPRQRGPTLAHGLLDYMKHVHVRRSQFEAIFAAVFAAEPVKYRPANVRAIREALTAVYQEAKTAGKRAPNVKDVRPFAKSKLNDKGIDATLKKIGDIADEREFQQLREPIGRRHYDS